MTTCPRTLSIVLALSCCKGRDEPPTAPMLPTAPTASSSGTHEIAPTGSASASATTHALREGGSLTPIFNDVVALEYVHLTEKCAVTVNYSCKHESVRDSEQVQRFFSAISAIGTDKAVGPKEEPISQCVGTTTMLYLLDRNRSPTGTIFLCDVTHQRRRDDSRAASLQVRVHGGRRWQDGGLRTRPRRGGAFARQSERDRVRESGGARMASTGGRFARGS